MFLSAAARQFPKRRLHFGAEKLLFVVKLPPVKLERQIFIAKNMSCQIIHFFSIYFLLKNSLFKKIKNKKLFYNEISTHPRKLFPLSESDGYLFLHMQNSLCKFPVLKWQFTSDRECRRGRGREYYTHTQKGNVFSRGCLKIIKKKVWAFA